MVERGKLDRSFARAKREWTPRELEILSDKWGLVSDKELTRLLQRSPNAIKVAATRHLHQSRSQNFYTAKNVADELGLSCSKTIIFWVESHWLQGRRSKVRSGDFWRWMFTQGQIEDCLRAHPWLCDQRTMPLSYFRSIVREEYLKDPWYSCEEAAPLLNLGCTETVRRYCRRGYLKAVRKTGGPWQGKLLIRRNEILKFLANDPRPGKSAVISSQRQKLFYQRGAPLKLYSYWSILCQLCGQRVLVQAHPRLLGHQVQEQFHQVFTNGTCSHGVKCVVEKEVEIK